MTVPIQTPVIKPAFYKYVLEVTVQFPSAIGAPAASQIAADAQTAIQNDPAINPQAVDVKAFVPAGSGE